MIEISHLAVCGPASFAYHPSLPPSPSPPLFYTAVQISNLRLYHHVLRLSSSISQATSSSVRNFITATFNIAITNQSIYLLFSPKKMRHNHLKLTKDKTMNFKDKLKLFRHWSIDPCLFSGTWVIMFVCR